MAASVDQARHVRKIKCTREPRLKGFGCEPIIAALYSVGRAWGVCARRYAPCESWVAYKFNLTQSERKTTSSIASQSSSTAWCGLIEMAELGVGDRHDILHFMLHPCCIQQPLKFKNR